MPHGPAATTEVLTTGRPSAALPPKRLVILVHGINGSARSWQTLLALARADDRLHDFTFETFEYATGLGRWDIRKQLPSLSTIASELTGFVTQLDFGKYRDIRLIGHSQGGLVIQRFLHRMLEAGRGRELDRIRQIVFFATPTLGSGLGMGVRQLVFSVVSNAQEKELRIFNPEVAATRRYLDTHLSRATERSKETAQIPVHVFYGEEDNVVNPESAMGSFSSTYAIPGDHTSLIAPRDAGDPRYKAFADILLEPIGHKHVFEVERSDYTLTLEPPGDDAIVQAALPNGKTRPVSSEVIGRYSRRVHFALRNRCEDLFEMRYGTRDDGYIKSRVVPPNQCSDAVARENAQRGTLFRYHFHPEQRREDGYAMHLVVHGGYDKGNRNVHFHVTRAGEDSWARIRNFSFELDMRPLVKAGFAITEEPQLYILDVDRKHEECPKAGDEIFAGALGELVAPEKHTESGLWRWSLSELERGIINVRWEAEPPQGAPHAG